MSIIKPTIVFIGITWFLAACNTAERQHVDLGPTSGPEAQAELRWAKDELDLQRVGSLLERSQNPQEFETYLNQDNGINNLDLNGDGYADYLSVEEFSDRGAHERGLSVYDCFGPDQIQEVATVVFYRDDPSWPGARVLLTGNDDLYGDNVYYETNWYDRPVDLISFEFGGHDPYRSPYYYNYYPSGYVTYDVVDTPVYVSHVQQLYPQPVLVYTQRPDFISKVQIRSPNSDKHFDQVFAKLVKPTREQQKFIAENHARPEHQKPEHAAKIDMPPAEEKGRGGNLPPGQEKAARRDDLVRGQPHEGIVERARGHEPPRVAAQPREQYRQPKQLQHVNIARAKQPRPNNPMPHGGRLAPQPNPHIKRPDPQVHVNGPPAGKSGPPAQRGGGGGKKKG